MTLNVRRVAVIGAGSMGHGIAQAAAQAGWDVSLTDARTEALTAATQSVSRNLAGAVSRGKLSQDGASQILARIHFLPTVAEACRESDLVIEAVVEDAGIKKAVLSEAAGIARPTALIASNTSSLSIRDLADALPRPERTLGLHFFNPVHLMKLVEVVVHDLTAAEAKSDALAVVAAMGKEAIVVRDSPGFASSRLGIALGLEAMRMLEEEVASAGDIDRAMELGYNHPMGPLRLTDLVGLDVRLKIAEYLHRTLGDTSFEPPAILRRLVAEGRLGKKSGGGFYDWPEG